MLYVARLLGLKNRTFRTLRTSDYHKRKGEVWKTLAIFNACGDRHVPDTRIATYPFRRTFRTTMVDRTCGKFFDRPTLLDRTQASTRVCRADRRIDRPE